METPDPEMLIQHETEALKKPGERKLEVERYVLVRANAFDVATLSRMLPQRKKLYSFGGYPRSWQSMCSSTRTWITSRGFSRA